MKVFVTGATGFVGRALCVELVKRGNVVTGLVRESRKGRQYFGDKIRIIEGDILKPHTFSKELADSDVVIHLAALRSNWGHQQEFDRVNARSVDNIFRNAHHAGHIVVTSSVYVFGDQGFEAIAEDAPLMANDVYGRSKIATERVTKEAGAKYRKRYTIIRPAIIYGQGDNELGFMTKLVKLIKQRKMPIIGSGDNLVHMVHINDLVEAYVKVISQEPNDETYIVAGARAIEFEQLVELVKKRFGLKYKNKRLSKLPFVLTAKVISVLWPKWLKVEPPISPIKLRPIIGNWHYDISKAAKKLGYKPKMNYIKGLVDYD